MVLQTDPQYYISNYSMPSTYSMPSICQASGAASTRINLRTQRRINHGGTQGTQSSSSAASLSSASWMLHVGSPPTLLASSAA